MNSLVAYGDSDSESEHEERVGTTDDKTQERVRTLIPVLPPIKGSAKQRVRIGLPKLDKEASKMLVHKLYSCLTHFYRKDESDEEVPSAKRLKPVGNTLVR